MTANNTRAVCLLLVTFLLASFICNSNGFFFEKLERLKRLPGISNLFPSNSNGVRVCINFNSNYPQGYQQNTCFVCDAYRFTQIASYCTGQSSIPININHTQANCIMNHCQSMASGQNALPGNRPLHSSSVGNNLNAINYPYANNYVQ